MPSPKEIEPLLAPIKPNDSLINNSNDSNFLPDSTFCLLLHKKKLILFLKKVKKKICLMVKEFYGKGKEKIIEIIFIKK